LYEKIALKEDWAPRFPMRYVQGPSPAPAPHINPGAATPAARAQPSGTDTMLANMQYKETLFGVFKAMNIKTRDILARTVNNPQPTSSDGTTLMCLSYHLKGICNERCGRKNDHLPHSTEQDQALLAWAQVHYTVAAA
jgi:hypothetical protein